MTPNDIIREITKTQAANALGQFLGAAGNPLDLNAPIQVLVDGSYRELSGLGVNAKGQFVLQVGDARRQLGRAL